MYFLLGLAKPLLNLPRLISNLARPITNYLDLVIHHPRIMAKYHLSQLLALKTTRLAPAAATGAGGYHIQAHVLHIPDRFGFFSPGPPALQMRQGSFVLGYAVAVLTLLLVKYVGRRPVVRAVYLLVHQVMFTALYNWVRELYVVLCRR
ncbi:hypothetical protein GGR53DRAFT_228507 [Hypoxylon sp. FL1150]|nr:hypothetical protein GGR53DRAFT_228507 [Hypoxylon sp. FL1150]